MAELSSAPGSASSSPTSYQLALTKVQPLVPILAGFNHRNKNQHRHARWWASFNSLRRNVCRLISELEGAVMRDARKSSKKRKREEQEGRGGGGGGAAEERARWMRDFLVKEAYLTFSQLAADNQFAVLGIVLLGVLASVHDACVHLVGEEATFGDTAINRASTSVAEPVVVEQPPKDMAMKSNVKHGILAENAVDFGQVVSREEIAAAFASSSEAKDQGVELPIKRKKKDIGSKVSDTPVETINPKKKTSERPDKVQKEKKKKKKSKDDEFDALFSSLV